MQRTCNCAARRREQAEATVATRNSLGGTGAGGGYFRDSEKCIGVCDTGDYCIVTGERVVGEYLPSEMSCHS
jgi:hypothetical protein